MVRRWSLLVLLLVVAAQANFNASPGFSGRYGLDCQACHAVSPVPAAQIEVEGLPSAWVPGESVDIHVRVTGGPPALPAPAPQGGFEIDADGGTFQIAPGMEPFTRLIAPHAVTYTALGTQMREWTVTWTAPTGAPPEPITLWVAAMAASGNHVVATNTSDFGEFFDATASAALTIPPSEQAIVAWQELPLAAPDAKVAGTMLSGEHQDGNATAIQWRIDGGPWQTRETGPTWRLQIDGLSAGDHTVEVRSIGADRSSDIVVLALHIDGFLEKVGLPAPFWPVTVGLFMVAWLRRP